MSTYNVTEERLEAFAQNVSDARFTVYESFLLLPLYGA